MWRRREGMEDAGIRELEARVEDVCFTAREIDVVVNMNRI
jgi:hypothetical protein